ncbi:uncharacterized protein LOC114522786 [Dendronephthya gigantea]|uniref:uncharacterized protein LOC114522786 n=1 Tax=Dendronephthya gigantea TaxID=151771 RepID=UPI001069C6F2|nr:uncharacterized protein LOC114522786 [Dendronephthya gigantea]
MNAWSREQVIQSSPVLQAGSQKVQTGVCGKVSSEYVPSVTISAKQSKLAHFVVPNPSMDTLKSGEESDGTGIRERKFARKYQSFSAGGAERVPKKTGKDQYWNQTTSSKLEKDKLIMGSKEWMDAHLTAVLDKAKMTRELCQMG